MRYEIVAAHCGLYDVSTDQRTTTGQYTIRRPGPATFFQPASGDPAFVDDFEYGHAFTLLGDVQLADLLVDNLLIDNTLAVCNEVGFQRLADVNL